MFESTLPTDADVLTWHADLLEPAVALSIAAEFGPSAQGLSVLGLVDLEQLSAHDRVTALGLWERYRSWMDAQLQRALVAVGGPAPAADDPRDDWAQEDVALALRLSTATASDRLQVARALRGRMALTGDALEAGAITYPHARALVDAVSDFDQPTALAVEAVMLGEAPPFETLTNFRRRLERAVIAADPRAADEQHLDAARGRKVTWWPEPYGMAVVQATLTADEAATAMRALTALARGAKADGDTRPIDNRRADAFSAMMRAALADPTLPTEQGARPVVGVTIDYATLIGLANNPAHLDGYGPIPPAMARRIAAGGDWHRLVTDPVTGALLDFGSTTYRPPRELVDFITARDRTCRFPTCSRPARLSDIDHAQPWQQGGSTSSHNCGGACRRNHRQKTQGNTSLVSHPDGSATWTTSSGHIYHQAAVDHCPEHTAHLRALRGSSPETEPPDPWDPDAPPVAPWHAGAPIDPAEAIQVRGQRSADHEVPTPGEAAHNKP